MDFALPIPDGQNLPDWAVDIPLPLGLSRADHIVTVSPAYAEEIRTPLYGAGLDGLGDEGLFGLGRSNGIYIPSGTRDNVQT